MIGYARVSKADGSQALHLQLDALAAAGIEADRIYDDSASGRKDDRPGVDACLKALQPGNSLVGWKLDRLGRDLKHLIRLIDDLRRRDVGFKVLAGDGAEINTSTANGRLVFALFAALAEFESELIAEPTRAGLAAARARGRAGGRPRKVDATLLRMAMREMADPETRTRQLARRLGIGVSTLYQFVNCDGPPKAAGKQIRYSAETSAGRGAKAQ